MNNSDKAKAETHLLFNDLNLAQQELEELKNKFSKKYKFIKEKYTHLKYSNKEKDEIIYVIILFNLSL